jgi:tetratricopeptide (TPR) repeat protein
MDKHQKKVRIQKFAALFISLMLVAVVVVSLIAPFAPSNVSNTPGEAERYVSLGQEAYADGNYNEAISYLNQSISLDSTYAYAYYCRGVVYNASGATEQAIADFQKCLTLNPDEETRQEVETYLEELGVTQ